MARRTRTVDRAGPDRLVFGVRPVAELIERRPEGVARLFVSRERGGLGRILRTAREKGIPVTHLPRELLSRKLGSGAAHQGVAAEVGAFPYRGLEEVCGAGGAAEGGILVLVDRVSDPGNLGAMIRTCAAAGVAGVVLGGGGTVGLTGQVAKAAAGTLERVPVGRTAAPARLLRRLRSRGFRALALAPRGEVAWDRVDYRGPLVVVAGGEARGPRRGVLQACNARVAIPLAREVDSLNVSVALGVLLFEARRQRGHAP